MNEFDFCGISPILTTAKKLFSTTTYKTAVIWQKGVEIMKCCKNGQWNYPQTLYQTGMACQGQTLKSNYVKKVL
jgi:hypothetical protein